ncbi:hypothetical protein PIB30_093126 [Stylosanthes scabra]|uniref:Uncharacterized protein n=1 Tax=Stylosanthes scabra TaxID=79078 RepID=A0ABU6VX30_9FABA|nr:hypothetical protein [Stylosanthes scabra]
MGRDADGIWFRSALMWWLETGSRRCSPQWYRLLWLANWGQCPTWTNFTASPFTAGNSVVTFDTPCDYFRTGKLLFNSPLRFPEQGVQQFGPVSPQPAGQLGCGFGAIVIMKAWLSGLFDDLKKMFLSSKEETCSDFDST